MFNVYCMFACVLAYVRFFHSVGVYICIFTHTYLYIYVYLQFRFRVAFACCGAAACSHIWECGAKHYPPGRPLAKIEGSTKNGREV